MDKEKKQDKLTHRPDQATEDNETAEIVNVVDSLP